MMKTVEAPGVEPGWCGFRGPPVTKTPPPIIEKGNIAIGPSQVFLAPTLDLRLVPPRWGVALPVILADRRGFSTPPIKKHRPKWNSNVSRPRQFT